MATERDDKIPAGLPARVYRNLVEVAIDIIAVLDGEGRIRFVNDAVTRVLGHRPAHVIGRSIADFCHPDDAQQVADRLQERGLITSPTNPTQILRLRHRDGSYRHLESLSVSRFDDPDVAGVYLIARDVTERIAVETERAIIKARRQLTARIARIGTFEWNSQTDELIADEEVRKLVRQRSEQRWPGMEQFLTRLLPEDREPLRQKLDVAANSGALASLVVRMSLPDERLRWLYLHAQNLHPDGPLSPWVLGLVMDITEQRQAEQEITRRGELLELAAWGANVGVWTWLPGEDRSLFNERCGQLLGIPAGELECTTSMLLSRVHPDDLPQLQRFETALIEGSSDVFDYAYRTRKDEAGWHWVMDRGRVTERDESGQAVRVSGVTLDIDEAKRREQELNDQKLRLDLALGASKLGLWDFDLVKDELFVDERYTGIVGLSAEILRRQYVEFERHIHEDDRSRLLAAGRECLEGRTGTLDFEGRLLKPDGRMIWVRVEGFVASRSADGRPARMIGTIADVSERLSEERLTRAGEQVAGLGSINFEFGSDRAYWSEGTHRIFEYPGDFVPRGDTILRLLLPAGGSAAPEIFRAAEEWGRDFDFESEASTARGRRIWVRIIGRVESFHGRPVRVYGIVQDITERRRLEAELLEAANREQQKLGSDLHDGLGQELTGISLLLQGLGQQVKAANPSLAEPLERISSLLSAAIRSTRSLAHGLAPVSLGRGGLEGALRILAEQASASYSVSVNLEIAGEAAPNLGEVAGNHVYRIVQEALSNAVRHGRARNITIQLAPTPLNFVLEVTDDGCGIEERAIRSGGFGLRSMKYRAQAIGGTLSVGKARGGGTLVRLTCPHPDV